MLPTIIVALATQSQAPVQPVSVWTPEGALITVGFGVIALLITMVGFLSKKQLDSILSTIHEFSARQSECRETLADRFANRAETKIDIKQLYCLTDRHDAIIKQHAVILGGRRHDDVVDVDREV